MEQIELVIKVRKEWYEGLLDYIQTARISGTLSVGALEKIIANGTPLPKGHGEIVDIQPLMRGLYEEMCTGEVTYTTSEVYKMLEEECQVIIKADKKGDTQ